MLVSGRVRKIQHTKIDGSENLSPFKYGDWGYMISIPVLLGRAGGGEVSKSQVYYLIYIELIYIYILYIYIYLFINLYCKQGMEFAYGNGLLHVAKKTRTKPLMMCLFPNSPTILPLQ